MHSMQKVSRNLTFLVGVGIGCQGPECTLHSGELAACAQGQPWQSICPVLHEGNHCVRKSCEKWQSVPLCLGTALKHRTLPSVSTVATALMPGRVPPPPPPAWTCWPALSLWTCLVVTERQLVLFTVSRPDPVTDLLTQLPGLTLDLPQGCGSGFLAEPCYSHWTCPACLVRVLWACAPCHCPCVP